MISIIFAPACQFPNGSRFRHICAIVCDWIRSYKKAFFIAKKATIPIASARNRCKILYIDIYKRVMIMCKNCHESNKVFLVGAMDVGGFSGDLGSPDFEIWNFPINVSAEKCFSLSFELLKCNFSTVGPPLENCFQPPPGKIHCCPPS